MLKQLLLKPAGRQRQSLVIEFSDSRDRRLSLLVSKSGAKRDLEITVPKTDGHTMYLTRDDAGRLLAALSAAMSFESPGQVAWKLGGLQVKPEEATRVR